MASPNGFPTFVNNQLPVAVAGDFAGANIRASVQAPPNGFTADPAGLIVGTFGWGDAATGIASNYYKPNSGLGFIHRENQGFITQFLGVATSNVLSGNPVTLMNQGDYWALFTGGATVGQTVYVDPGTGIAVAGAAGGLNYVTATGSVGATGTGTLTNLSTTLTVASVTAGVINPGDVVAGTSIPVGTTILSQLTGTGSGGTGTYQMSAAATATVGSAEAITFTGSTLDVTAVSAGVIRVGDVLTGSSVSTSPATRVTGLLTGTGGLGKYTVSPAQQFASTTISAAYIATNFVCASNVKVAVVATGSIAATQIMTITAVSSGVLEQDQFVSGTGVPANVQIISQLTSTATGGALGSTGTYLVSSPPGLVVNSETLGAVAGQLGKISSWGP